MNPHYLERIDRVFRPLAIPNLTAVLVGGQLIAFVLAFIEPQLFERSFLIWNRVMAGEVWRLLTFAFIPPTPTTSPFGLVFVVFYFLIFYQLGTTMEREWGNTRYCSYLYLGLLLTIIASVVNPLQPITGLFLELTVFLAFAVYYPNYEFRVMFIIPVKVKYLAMLQGGLYVALILFSEGWQRLVPLAALSNFIIFFARG